MSARQLHSDDSLFIASYICLVIVSFCLLLYDDMRHWFLFPLLVSGALTGSDVLDWVRNRIDLFDPIGIIGIVGWYSFFLSPLLIVLTQHKLAYLSSQPDDYRPWLGGMAILNSLGLLCYSAAHRRVFSAARPQNDTPTWAIDSRRLVAVLVLALAISGSAQLWAYLEFGGITGYIDAYFASVMGERSFENMGWLFTISESFPILLVIGFAAYPLHTTLRRSWLLIAAVVLIFLLLQWLFGGLRGSRSNFVWNIFWAFGILHFTVRKLPRITLPITVPIFLVFMYGYAFYKDLGPKAMDLFSDADTARHLNDTSSRSIRALLISDLSRSDIQAYLLSRLLTTDFSYAYGRTYIGAVTLLVPRQLWPNRLPTKQRWTSEAEYYTAGVPGGLVSSRVYGLGGEAMLNFGPIGVPLSFAALGIIVGLVRRKIVTLVPCDTSWLVIPLVINMCLILLIGDSDNSVVFLVKYGLVPCIVVLSFSRRIVSSSQTRLAPSIMLSASHESHIRF